jgi:hypothetical protein
MFQVGGQMEQVFQALIDRNRAVLGLDQVKTLFGCKKRPCYRKRKSQPGETAEIRRVQCENVVDSVYVHGSAKRASWTCTPEMLYWTTIWHHRR